MANITLRAYDADVRAPAFLGLMQQGDGILNDLRFAAEANNIETPGGVLQPMAAASLLPASLPKKIETLAVLHRRWYKGADPSPKVLVAASGGSLYYMVAGTSAWVKINHPEGAAVLFASNSWSWVQYEIAAASAELDPIDVLILSNQKDGMVYLRCDDAAKTITKVPTPKRFGVITRFNERIWGGDIAEDPDMVMYSAPYDFTNWAQNNEIPEDGAGDIQQSTWDGDSFTALIQMGPQLLALRRNTVWRVLGTDPGEFTWKQQYGGGTAYEHTICVEGERMLLLGDTGVMQYDGLSVQPYYQEACETFWKTLNKSALEQSCACVHKHKYYLSIPTNSSGTNNAVVVFDMKERTWLLRTDVAVEAWLPTENALYFTSVAEPGRVYTWVEDAWVGGAAATPVKWVSPWVDFARKDLRKGGWTVYLLLEAKSAGQISVSVETEKKKKTKVYAFEATVGQAKSKRLQFGGSGRRFKLHIEAAGAAVWRLISGIQLIVETDPD